MYIGACRMTFSLPGNRSLKGKRQVVRRVCERIRSKFHAAAAEVGDPEQWSEAEIAFAVVSNNHVHARAMAENVVGYLEDLMVAPLREVELEVIKFDDVSTGGTATDVERWRDGSAVAKLGEGYEPDADDEGA
jgi:uncharacterized protein YlxP (DUF503 family)